MSRFMRLLVFFDFPVKTKDQRRAAAKFRQFPLQDGYHMMQYSVYNRPCNGWDSLETHVQRVQRAVPRCGSVRILPVTEKQYNSIQVLVDTKTVYDAPMQDGVLTEL